MIAPPNYCVDGACASSHNAPRVQAHLIHHFQLSHISALQPQNLVIFHRNDTVGGLWSTYEECIDRGGVSASDNNDTYVIHVDVIFSLNLIDT